MRNLNKASFDVWSDYIKDYKHADITDRILFLDTFNKMTEEEESEYAILLNLEKKFLTESEITVDSNRRYLRAFNLYKNILEQHDDDRLLTIFFERIQDSLAEKSICEEEDVTRIYHEMMEEDMDVTGHDNLTKFYEEIKKEETEPMLGCGLPECLNCNPIYDEEYLDAVDDLTEQGFFNEDLSEREHMIRLMVMINRLQDELAIYRAGDGEDFLDYDEE